MELDKVELHDGVIKIMTVDYTTGSIGIEIEYFRSAESTVRTGALIEFSNVLAESTIINLKDLKDNSSAGNINYVRTEKGEGKYFKTYIYLVNGCIEIVAENINLVDRGI